MKFQIQASQSNDINIIG